MADITITVNIVDDVSLAEVSAPVAVVVGNISAGARGATGATGATGPQGPRGETGATGPQGPAGDGSGNVVGPGISTDNALARYDGATGTILQNSSASVNDSGILSANGMNLAPGYALATNIIEEASAASGVTIDGALLKDGGANFTSPVTASLVSTDTVSEKTAAAGVTAGGVLLKDGNITAPGDGTLAHLNLGAYGVVESRVNLDSEHSATLTSTQSVDIQLGASGYFNVYDDASSNALFYVGDGGAGINIPIRGVVYPNTNFLVSTSTYSPDVSTYGTGGVTALGANLTIGSPAGTPHNGGKFMFRIKDNGTPRTLTWDAIYRAVGVTLPTTTVANKVMYVGMVYNSAATKWDVIAVAVEA